MLMLAGNMKYPGVNIRLAWPVLVSLLQLHNPAVVQLDVVLTKRLCSNNARPSGSSGTLFTSFTLHLRRTVTRPLPVLPYTRHPSVSAGQPTSRITVHPSFFSLCRTVNFPYYRTPFILQSLQDSQLPVLPYTLHPSVSAGQPPSCPTVHPSLFSHCRTDHFRYVGFKLALFSFDSDENIAWVKPTLHDHSF